MWHREILYAMSEGIHVFGASSMGALRAAELHGLGMRGIGTVFEAYRQNVFAPYPPPFERDEEVAVMHGPPETGFVDAQDIGRPETLVECAGHRPLLAQSTSVSGRPIRMVLPPQCPAFASCSTHGPCRIPIGRR